LLGTRTQSVAHLSGRHRGLATEGGYRPGGYRGSSRGSAGAQAGVGRSVKPAWGRDVGLLVRDRKPSPGTPGPCEDVPTHIPSVRTAPTDVTVANAFAPQIEWPGPRS
jgi:hypothetical protein